MLPIVPAGKKGAARKRPRPRPRAPPSGAGGGRRKSGRPPPKSQSAEGEAPSPPTDQDAAEHRQNAAAPPTAKEGAIAAAPAAPAGTAPANNELAAAKNTPPSPSPNPHTTNAPHTPAAEEDPLILAAEAAAALMDDLPAGSAGDVADISLPVALPAGLLDAVDASVDAAAGALVERGALDEGDEGATLGAAKEGGGDVTLKKGGGDGTDAAGEARPKAQGDNHPLKKAPPQNAPNALPNHSIGNPLGRNVRTFESKVPRHQDASAAQRRFLAYYYGQEAARGNALAVRTRKANAEEEEEEEVVEDDGEGGDAAGENAEMEKTGAEDTGAKKKDGGKTAPDGRGGTLRDSIATLKRARYEPKRKDDKGTLWKAEDAEEADLVAAPAAGGGNAAAEGSTADADNGDNGDANETAAPKPPPTGPQVELDSAGRISVAPASLLPNPAARPTPAAIDAELGEVVEDATPARLGAIHARYDSYAKPRQKPARWDADETRAWYRALRQCGTDFGMMAAFLPGRTRAQLKRKYKSEGRRHPKLVDMALDPRSRVRLDLSVFGDKLEIPNEVPLFQRVTPADSPTPGAAAATEAAGKEGGANTGERNFDYLFEQDDGAAAGEQKEDAAVEECEPPAQKGEAVPAATTGPDDAAEAPTEGAKASEAVVPLAPAVPKAKGAKRARFKAKPKGAKRARKK